MEEEITKKLQGDVARLTKEVKTLAGLFNYHKHLGVDKSKIIDGDLNLALNSVFSIGRFGEIFKVKHLNLPAEQDSLHGLLNVNLIGGTFSHTGMVSNWTDSPNDRSNAGFFYAYHAPFVSEGSGSITLAGTFLTDTTRTFTVNELLGEVLYISNASGSIQEGHTVASNTANTITINGTFAATTDNYKYSVANLVYLGNASFPWRRLYAEEIRLGNGASASSTVSWIKVGNGNPNTTTTGNPGSLFLAMDNTYIGTAGLWVKESGFNTDTGWIHK